MDAVVGWNETGATPADLIAQVEARGERLTTRHAAGEVVWRCFGRGEPLVLLHGGFGSWAHWVRNVEALSANYRLLVPDMPGFGDSDETPQPFAPGTLSDALASGLRELVDGKPVAIAGFSFGGIIGGLTAQRGVAPVHTLVLVGAAGMGLPRKPLSMVSWRKAASETERLAGHRTNLGQLMIWGRGKIDDLAVHLQDRNTARTRVRSRPIAHTPILREAMQDVARRGGALAGIWGEHDATAAPWIEERRALFHDIQPQAPFEVIPGAGHWVQYEAPQRFNATLLNVLERTRSA